MVNSAPDFGDHPKVINGCSDLLVEVFGEKGRHARSAVGMSAPAFGSGRGNRDDRRGGISTTPAGPAAYAEPGLRLGPCAACCKRPLRSNAQ